MGEANNYIVADRKEVWIVIPVHNRCATTAQCLECLSGLGVLSWAQVLVVDDGSTDGTRNMLEHDFPGVQIVAGDGQLWWSGAIRLGMETAIRGGAGCIVWLNDDTLPKSGALELLVRLAVEKTAVCGGVTRTAPTIFVYAGGIMRRGWPRRLPSVPGPEAEPLPVHWLNGNMVAIPAAVWRRIGLNEACWMKHNFADFEYSVRAHAMGIPVLLVPAAEAVGEYNDSSSYWSWLDPRLSWWAVLSGFSNPKVWWYLPGMFYFSLTAGGAPGVLKCICVCLQAILLGGYKGLPIRWLTEYTKKTRACPE